MHPPTIISLNNISARLAPTVGTHDLSVVSLWEVLRSPAIAPGDSTLWQGNRRLSSPASTPRQGTYSALLGYPVAAFRRELAGSNHAGSQSASSVTTVAKTWDDFPRAPTVVCYLARHISKYIVACRLTYTGFVMPTRTSPDRRECTSATVLVGMKPPDADACR